MSAPREPWCDARVLGLRDDVAAYRANGTIVTDETLRAWERRLARIAFEQQPESANGQSAPRP